MFGLAGPIERHEPRQQAWMQVNLQFGEDRIIFEQHPKQSVKARVH
jgi:hypothetical protein